jgi:choline transport protein
VDACQPPLQNASQCYVSLWHCSLCKLIAPELVEQSDLWQLYGLIFLGSTAAFSAMVSAAIVFLQTSCIAPQAILLYRGRDKVLPPRYFSLGKYGTAVNATAVTWVIFLDIIYCFPTAMPVTPQNMNFVSVVTIGLTLFVLGLWFTSKRGKFVGPKINMAELEARRLAAMGGSSSIEGTEQHATEYVTSVKRMD